MIKSVKGSEIKTEVDYIFESINNAFNMEMLLGGSKADELRIAIQNGLDDFKESSIVKTEVIIADEVTLTEKQFNEVKKELKISYSLYHSHNHNNDDCNCGAWCVELEGLGYFTLINVCKESSDCPSGKLWHINNQAYIYDKSIISECFDWSDIDTLYKVNDKQVEILKDIANKTLAEGKAYNEYGKKL